MARKVTKLTVLAECSSCQGTGIYHGFAEPEGVGVVCLNCEGTGAVKIIYTPFTKRRKRQGIETVRWSRGGFIAAGVGPTGESITYEEFLAGKFPPTTQKKRGKK